MALRCQPASGEHSVPVGQTVTVDVAYLGHRGAQVKYAGKTRTSDRRQRSGDWVFCHASWSCMAY